MIQLTDYTSIVETVSEGGAELTKYCALPSPFSTTIGMLASNTNYASHVYNISSLIGTYYYTANSTVQFAIEASQFDAVKTQRTSLNNGYCTSRRASCINQVSNITARCR